MYSVNPCPDSAVADKVQRPLYRLQTDDLNSRRGSFDEKLSHAFDIATEWNAILLLDGSSNICHSSRVKLIERAEADVFLTKRSLNEQNSGLVSGKVLRFILQSGCPVLSWMIWVDDIGASLALLRHIEYFPGILFLTTNILSNIDDAFMSRVHIHLCYPPLDFGARLQVWDNNLSRLEATLASTEAYEQMGSAINDPAFPKPSVRFSSADLKEVACWELNGRHVRNVVKNTHLWCLYNHSDVTLARLVASIQVTAPFAEKSSPEEDPMSSTAKRRRIEH